MKEFIEKLIGRLEEEKQRLKKLKNDTIALSDSEVIAIEEQSYNFCKKIVNQLAEEYNNDFCEWKKTDKRKSSPYHHALKHGNITLEFHDDFKFFPYCGKKIKIAPYQPKGE